VLAPADGSADGATKRGLGGRCHAGGAQALLHDDFVVDQESSAVESS
jgi:hypothetical protein